MAKSYRVHMYSRPAVGRTFYDGVVSVLAENDDDAIQIAIDRAARVHGHYDWVVVKVERIMGGL
jgi:hypothetical protein